MKIKDITVEQFIKLKQMVSLNDESRIKTEAIKLFKLEKLQHDEAHKILDNIYSSLKETPEFTQRFIFNGVEYGFIPDLEKITAGEWIDIENYQSNEEKIHLLLSILYRPIKKSFWSWNKKNYQIEEYNGTNDNFKDLSVDIYLGCRLFFSILNTELLLDSLIYIQKKLKRETMKTYLIRFLSQKKLVSKKNLVGIQ